MKVLVLLFLASASALVRAESNDMNPLEKVLQMLGGLQAQLIKEGEHAQKVYGEFSAWCEDRSQELHFAIKTEKGEVGALNAGIDKASADSQALESKIGDRASDIADSESELKQATGIRDSEKKEFAEVERELVKTVNTLENAMSVLHDKGSAFLQQQNQHSAQSVVKALQAIVEASSVSSSDATRLTALIQSSSDSEDGDDEVGAPSAAEFENQSGGIVGVLQGLLDKAEEQLDAARKEESNSAHEYAMKKQSLDDASKDANEELTESKSSLASVTEKKAGHEGDLTRTTKDLKEDVKSLEELHHTCLGKATDFEEETKSRNDELGALAQAKKIIKETTGAASEQTYDLVDTSFLQVRSKQTLSNSAQALRIIRRLAYKGHSPTLVQLASRIQSSMRLGTADGADPFKKVRGMIMDMLATLEKEAEAEATEKAYCDKELAETKVKLDDKTDESNKHSTKIAQMQGASQKLKGEIVTLQNELASLAKSQAEMDQLRQKENAAYKVNRPEMESGLNGVKQALKVLKEYYAKPAFVQMEAGTTGPSAIIGLLEVAESDFSKLLAEIIAEEEQAEALYTETSNENAVDKAAKDEDVKGKTKEAAGLDKGSAERKSDLSGVSDELSAITEYDKQLQSRCTKKPPSYEEIKKRREAEIAGLQDALATLEGNAVLLQGSVSHRTLRGIRRA